jgi:hypothetical protein
VSTFPKEVLVRFCIFQEPPFRYKYLQLEDL